MSYAQNLGVLTEEERQAIERAEIVNKNTPRPLIVIDCKGVLFSFNFLTSINIFVYRDIVVVEGNITSRKIFL